MKKTIPKQDAEVQENLLMPNAEDFQKDFDCVNAKFVGAGTFGKVYKCQDQNKQWKAYKMVEAPSEDLYNKSLKELQLNRLVNIHPNVIYFEKTYAWIETIPVKRYLLVFIMRLAEGNLKDLIIKQKGQYYDQVEFQSIAEQLINVFEFLMNQKKLFHRDIKPENICYEIPKHGGVQVRITDFGASKAFQTQAQMKNTLVGTPQYLSPKLWEAYIKGQTTDIKHNLEKSDVFSLGVTLLQAYLLLKDNEINGLNDASSNKVEQLLLRVQDANLLTLFQGMLNMDEKQRFTWLQCQRVFNPDQEPQYVKQPSVKNYKIPISYQKMYHSADENLQLRLVKQIAVDQEVKGLYCYKDKILMWNSEGFKVYDLDGKQVEDRKIVDIKWIIQFQNKFLFLQKGQLRFLDNAPLEIFQQKITTMAPMLEHLLLVGLEKGQVCIVDFQQRPPISLNSIADHSLPIQKIEYCEDELLIIVDTNNISVRYIKNNLVAFKKMDYPIKMLERLDETRLAVNGVNQKEILILHICQMDDFRLEASRFIQYHTALPTQIKLVGDKCMLVATGEQAVIYDRGINYLIAPGLRFMYAQWHDEHGYLITSDGTNIGKWVILDGQEQMIGKAGPQKVKKRKCCTCCPVM